MLVPGSADINFYIKNNAILTSELYLNDLKIKVLKNLRVVLYKNSIM